MIHYVMQLAVSVIGALGRAKYARKRFRMLFTENVYGVYLEESKRLKLGLYIETLKELPV